MINKIYILWNDNLKVKNNYKIKFDSLTYDFIFIQSYHELLLSIEDIKKIDCAAIIVLCELTWKNSDGKSYAYTDLFGIDLVKKELRLKLSLKQPILFVSMLPMEMILQNSSNRILQAVGHDFIQLPFHIDTSIDSINNNEALSDIQLLDIQTNYCTINGIIGDIEHRYSGHSGEGIQKFDNEKIKKHFSNYINEIRTVYPSDYNSRWDEYYEKLEELIENKNYNSIYTLFKTIREDLVFPDEIIDSRESQEKSKGNWKILILEDEPETIKNLILALQNRGINEDNIIIRTTYEEAKEEIEKDIYNFITVVLSDYRLEENWINGNNLKRHQKKQGYDFIEYVAKLDRFNELFVLSGLSRKFLLKSFSGYTRKPNIFSKTDLNQSPTNAVNMLADMILDKGNEMYDSLNNQPLQKTEWEKMKKFYIEYRLSSEYNSYEDFVSKKALKYCNEIDKLQKQINKRTSFKYQFSLNRLSDGAQCDITKRDIKKDMQVFLHFLVVRRVISYLPLIGFDNQSDIITILDGYLLKDYYLNILKKTLKPNKKTGKIIPEEYIEGRGKQIFNNLAFSLSNYPFDLLVEEKAWLNKNYNYSGKYCSNELVLSQVEIFFEESFNYYLQKNARLKTLIYNQLETNKYLNYQKNISFFSLIQVKEFIEFLTNVLNIQGTKNEQTELKIQNRKIRDYILGNYDNNFSAHLLNFLKLNI